MVISPDKLFLFAVNEGSNDVSVFSIRLDGTLRLVPGSPFASGGKFPTSLAWQNGYLYVANRGDGILPVAAAPTYTPGTRGSTNFSVFQIAGNGALTLQPTMTLEVPDGSSPGQIVSSNDGQFLWGLVPLYPTNNPPGDIPPAAIFPEGQSRMLSFSVDQDDGALNNAGAEVFLPPTNPLFTVGGVFKGAFMLGMRVHPTQPILYVNSLLASVLTVWNWNPNGSGELSFVTAVDPGAVGRGGAPCWTAVDPLGRYAYTASVVTDGVSAFSLTNPMAPVALQNLVLGGPKGPLPAGTPEPYQSTTAPFNLQVDPTGTYVYVSNHATCVANSIDSVNCPIGNAIHILKINADGTLTEQPYSPFIYPPEVEPTNARPKGLIVL
jgi:DNA-binding beta-propeller fold protein YncE